VERLVALGLLEHALDADGAPAVRARPALDRYRVGETVLLEPGQSAPRTAAKRRSTANRKKGTTR
jgi:hypothetical protein